MAKRNPLIIEHRKYNHIFPFHLVMIYKKNGNFAEMITEASITQPELEGLKLDIEGKVISFVYSPPSSSRIYLFLTDDFKFDTLIHECNHIVFQVYNKMCMEVSTDSEEFFAYMDEFIAREIIDACKTLFKLKVKL